MKNLTKTPVRIAIAAAYLMSCAVVYAATIAKNVDDVSEIGTSDTQPIKQQEKKTDKKYNNKTLGKNEMKAMDTNRDGVVSKDEYMMFQEKAYQDMKPGDNGISYKSSMNNKPIGTTTGVSENGSVDVTKSGPINGTTTGTNN